MRIYQITVRNRPAALVLAAAAVVAGGALIAIGLALAAGLVVGGALLGGGVLLLRRAARGHGAGSSRRSARVYQGLDPAQEVFPPPADPPRTIGRAD
jgi:hypothetical protein